MVPVKSGLLSDLFPCNLRGNQVARPSRALMNITSSTPPPLTTGKRPPTWAFVLAFGIVYVGYGFNFLAIRVGVETMPPFIFAGAHVILAGLILFSWQLLRGQSLAISKSGLSKAALSSLFLFVGGVGLVTAGEKNGVPSGMAAVIKASVPLWVAILETLRPHGEKINRRMLIGLLLGAFGVIYMIAPQLDPAAAGAHPFGTTLLVMSALLFAIGTLIVRHWPPCPSIFTAISYQMIIGGAYLLVLGLCLNELSEINAAAFTGPVIGAFCFLLFIHSLCAFTAMNWLLRYLPASLVTTKFYVSPVVAVFAGWLILDEALTLRIIGCMLMILAGVFVILWQGQKTPAREHALKADELED